ncbi:hypothetical protein L9F63_020197, partial [Diploptera punctata]
MRFYSRCKTVQVHACFIMLRPVNLHCTKYNFCYICDELAFKSQRRNFTPLVKECYELYFGCQ